MGKFGVGNRVQTGVVTPKPQVEEVAPQPQQTQTVTINGKTYSREAYDKAVYAVQKKSSGGRITFYNEGEAFAIYQELLKDPSIKRAIERGNELKEKAREAGFDNVEEYSSVSKVYQKEAAQYQQQKQQEVITKAKEQGFTPVYQDGKLVGFNDEVRKQSIPVSIQYEDKERGQSVQVNNLNSAINKDPSLRQRLEASKFIAPQQPQKENILEIIKKQNAPVQTTIGELDRRGPIQKTHDLYERGIFIFSDKIGKATEAALGKMGLPEKYQKVSVYVKVPGVVDFATLNLNPVRIVSKPFDDSYQKIGRMQSDFIEKLYKKSAPTINNPFGTSGNTPKNYWLNEYRSFSRGNPIKIAETDIKNIISQTVNFGMFYAPVIGTFRAGLWGASLLERGSVGTYRTLKTQGPSGLYPAIKEEITKQNEIKKAEEQKIRELPPELKELPLQDQENYKKDVREYNKAVDEQVKAIKTGRNMALGAAALALLYGGYRGAKYLREEVVVTRFPKPKPIIKSDTVLVNILQGEKGLDIAEFNIIAAKGAEKAFFAKRYEVLLNKFLNYGPAGKVSELSVDELLLKFPGGKVKEIAPPSVVVSKTEPFIVKNGEIIGPLRKNNLGVDIFTLRGTPNRIEPLTVSKLTGTIRKNSQEIDKINREMLDALNRKSLEELEKIGSGKGINIKRNYPKETKLETGEVSVKDIAKVTKTDIKILPYGRRTARGEVTAIQEPGRSVSFAEREFGLKEYEELKDSLAVVDTTMPRLPAEKITKDLYLNKYVEDLLEINEYSPKIRFRTRTPKDVTIMHGITKRYLVELPAPSTPNFIEKFIKPSRDQTLKQIETQNNLKAINELKAAALLKISKGINKLPKAVKAIQEPSLALPKSSYAGLGLYERTEGMIIGHPSKENQRSITKGNFRNSFIAREEITNKQVNPVVSKDIIKSVNREISRSIPREIAREIIKEIPREVPREIIKQTPREIVKPVIKPIQKPSIKPLPRITPPRSPPRKPTPPKTPPPFKLGFDPGKSLGRNLIPGYKTFIKKRGKEVLLPGIRSKGEALMFGEKIARNTLAATFGIKKTLNRIYGKASSYNINKNLFRTYRVNRGKRLPLLDTFIQRRNKRLSSLPERRAIQRVRFKWY